jgi:alpha-1,3-rhamnosyltransferase
VRTELITSPVNTGTSANCNRGLRAAKGEWLKFIAGDDMLTKNCIEALVNFVVENPSCNIVFGKIILKKNKYLIHVEHSEISKMDKSGQFEKILSINNGLYTPGYLIKRKFLKEIKGFEEKYSLIEDLPLWLKLVKNDEKLCFLEQFVAVYRVHKSGITKSNSYLINERYFLCLKAIFQHEIIPELKKRKRYLSLLDIYNYFLVYEVIIFLGNRNNLLNKALQFLYLKRALKLPFILYNKIIKNNYREIKNNENPDCKYF